MNKIVVIHHSADYDGIFCREISRKFLPEATLIGWDYGDPIPIMLPEEMEQLYMLDISIADLMDHPKLIWIDHHKSAIEKYPLGIPGYRIDGVAACRLAWQWFYLHEAPATIFHDKSAYVERRVREPLAVRLAGEYDIWDHKGDGDIEFQFGLDSLKEIDWNLLLDGNGIGDGYARQIVGAGTSAMNCYAKRDADVMFSRSFLAIFEGLKFICLNTARCNSNTFAALDVPATGHDALLAFYFNGTTFSFSLYHAAHRKDIDLSKIAVKYGGGGHRGACRFRMPFMPSSFISVETPKL